MCVSTGSSYYIVATYTEIIHCPGTTILCEVLMAIQSVKRLDRMHSFLQQLKMPVIPSTSSVRSWGGVHTSLQKLVDT